MLNVSSIIVLIYETVPHSGRRTFTKEEILALKQNNTWDLVPLAHEKSAVGFKWVYSVEVNHDGSVPRLKSMLTTRGFSQTYSVKTFFFQLLR